MGGTIVLYHIGKRKPKPVSNSFGWVRDYSSQPITKPVVFLTPKFENVWYEHGKRGNLYVYRTSNKVVKLCGGIRSFDCAKEVIIREEYWHECKFLGKKDEKWVIRYLLYKTSYRSNSHTPPGAELGGENTRRLACLGYDNFDLRCRLYSKVKERKLPNTQGK